MNITITIFQIDFDRFSALAFDVDHQGHVWKASYESRAALIRGLDRTGVITPAEINQIKQPSYFEDGAPVFHASLSVDEIEKAGFSPNHSTERP